ncbi:hypothetical protein CGT98_08870 [Vibrio metoecus]|uniref:hypothetical protein n=1 Tax=Vibrio metoecus TaxID=1481663 RepID=UPI000BA9CC19|nr:hypothetical protein [Vibrio metoecus]PAR39432.1 hypothetical protein CGT98_08870 [Vibrio metoecus]
MFKLKKLPQSITINIPTVRDDMSGFYNLWDRLYGLDWKETTKYYIILDFSNCHFAGFTLTAMLGAFVYFVRRKLINSTIRIETKTMDLHVYLKLRNMGLLESLDKLDGRGFTQKTEDIIPYREFPPSTKEGDILSYLRDEWLGKNRLNFSEEVESAVLSSLWEVYANAFEHSGTHQVQSCGSYDRKTNTLTLLVGDAGHGIVTSVRKYLESELTAKDALEWALIRGNSTYTANLIEGGEKQPRGLGLHLLTQLVDVNGGSMEIYTDCIFYSRYSGKSLYQNKSQNIKGSWIKLTLECKQDVKYFFRDEEIPKYI